MSVDVEKLKREVAARRTFAIISHPDAGKTTLTEKVLLYGGAIHLAGSVKQSRGGSRAATSDWMEIERQRGISISTSVLQFEYRGRQINLLDTPGHNDFSEDTYRTLAAADSAVMLIDSVKGVEPQTIKLFQVCRMRGIPIITFINKLDRGGKEPLDLLDEIERVLGIPCSPVNWPIGSGQSFYGVYDRWRQRALHFERADGGARRAPMTEGALDDEEIAEAIGATRHRQLTDELALLETAGNAFDSDLFLRGRRDAGLLRQRHDQLRARAVPGSLRDAGAAAAPAHRRRRATLAADAPTFSGFVFKIQANMDPNHRDRIAFVRICSGRFTRGMEVFHVRTGKTLALTRPLQFMAQERTMIDEAYSGDIIGLWDGGNLRIGDTLCEGPQVEFEGIPRFSPEHFVRVRLTDPLKRKQLKKGLDQLSEEGAVQLFFDRMRLERDPVLGAVGVLQFEVIQHRLKSEYGVNVGFDRLPYLHARWLEGGPVNLDKFERPGSTTSVLDVEGRPLVLFANDWAMRTAIQDNPQLQFIAAVQPGRGARPAA